MSILELPPTQSSVLAMICTQPNIMDIKNAPLKLLADVIGHEWHLNGDDLFKETRVKKIREARQLLHYFLRVHQDRTFKEVGDLFNMHHSTIIHNVEVIEREMAMYENVQERHDRVKRDIFAKCNEIKVTIYVLGQGFLIINIL